MYDTTITVFNHYKDKKKNVTWYPSILSNCNINMDKAAITAKYGSESKDNAALNIKCTAKDGSIYIGKKLWLPPKEWARQDVDLLPQLITFADGQDFDFFYVGAWKEEEPIGDDDYGIDGFYNYMNKYYDYVFAISSSARYSVIPHFEVMGA